MHGDHLMSDSGNRERDSAPMIDQPAMPKRNDKAHDNVETIYALIWDVLNLVLLCVALGGTDFVRSWYQPLKLTHDVLGTNSVCGSNATHTNATQTMCTEVQHENLHMIAVFIILLIVVVVVQILVRQMGKQIMYLSALLHTLRVAFLGLILGFAVDDVVVPGSNLYGDKGLFLTVVAVSLLLSREVSSLGNWLTKHKFAVHGAHAMAQLVLVSLAASYAYYPGTDANGDSHAEIFSQAFVDKSKEHSNGIRNSTVFAVVLCSIHSLMALFEVSMQAKTTKAIKMLNYLHLFLAVSEAGAFVSALVYTQRINDVKDSYFEHSITVATNGQVYMTVAAFLAFSQVAISGIMNGSLQFDRKGDRLGMYFGESLKPRNRLYALESGAQYTPASVGNAMSF